jgi:hypothetical protein
MTYIGPARLIAGCTSQLLRTLSGESLASIDTAVDSLQYLAGLSFQCRVDLVNRGERVRWDVCPRQVLERVDDRPRQLGGYDSQST